MKITSFLFFLSLLFSNAALADSAPHLPGIIGADDRKILEETNAYFNAVGRVNFAGYKSRSLCTGTLISPNKVVSAAHCIINRRTGKPYSSGPIHFVAGYRKGSFKGHSIVKEITFLEGFSPAEKGLSFFKKDVAILTLENSLTIKPIPIKTSPQNDILSHISYGRDREHLPVIHENCRKIKAQESLYLTDCDTNFGGSGGPVFIMHDDQPQLVAIVVGIAKRQFSVALSSQAWQHLIHQGQ